MIDRQRGQRARELGETARRRPAVAREEHALPVFARADHAIAVVLHLEQPVRARERRLDALGEHRAQRGCRELAARRTGLLDRALERREARRAIAALVDREPGEHRSVPARIDGVAREAVGLLDQEPVLRVSTCPIFARLRLAARGPRPLATRPHERELAAQLVALEVEQELSAREPFFRVLDGNPAPEVPDDHGPRPVVPLGNHALEVRVLDRMVLDVHGEPLLGRVERGALRHRPGEQHAAPFEPQVVVEPARGVLLHHEQARAVGALGPERLRSAVGVALGAIGAQFARLAFTQLAAPGHRFPPQIAPHFVRVDALRGLA